MIPLPSGTKIWLVAGITDMRNGFNGLAAKVQTAVVYRRRAVPADQTAGARPLRLTVSP